MVIPLRPTRRRARLVAAVAVLLTVALTGCTATAAPPTVPSAPVAPLTVRVGSANFAENRLLAEIYAIGLESRGVTVKRRLGAGPREVYYPALLDGSLDVVPEYTGNLLLFLESAPTETQPDEVYQDLTQRIPPSLRLLAKSRAQDADAVVVTEGFARQNDLHSIDDLARLCPAIAFGGPPEFQSRPYGTPGLEENYGCTFREFRPLDAGGPRTVAALRNGDIQAADLFSSDPSIAQNRFVTLADPRSNFADQSVVPLVSAATAADPRARDVLDRISATLDTTALTDLNRRLADPSRPDIARVARDWLCDVRVLTC